MLVGESALFLVWTPLALQSAPTGGGGAHEVVQRILGFVLGVETALELAIALALIAVFVLIWLALIWVPYRVIVAVRNHYERRRAMGREREWLRTRLGDLKEQNRLLREKLEEYEPRRGHLA